MTDIDLRNMSVETVAAMLRDQAELIDRLTDERDEYKIAVDHVEDLESVGLSKNDESIMAIAASEAKREIMANLAAESKALEKDYAQTVLRMVSNQGYKVMAVKAWMDRTDCSISEAKDAITNWDR